MNICRYTRDKQQEWDAFVRGAKNGTFLFLRDYMDYHAERFADHSLMYYDDKGRLTAIMPANEDDRILYSHQGLTYGGLILTTKIHATDVGNIFTLTVAYLREHGFTGWYYKQIPSIYCQYPSQEDEYWLWRNNATLACCNLSCTIKMDGNMPTPWERRRKRGLKRALEAGMHITEDADIETFWPIMVENLRDKYGAAPIHSLEEMKMLHSRFPDNIHIYLCLDSDNIARAGAVVYATNPQTIHVQYAHADKMGKKNGAIDLLYSVLIDKYRTSGYTYFDIGTSNEQAGRILNEKLIEQKEGFGGRGIVYKQWRITL